MHHVESQGILCETQFGIRQNHSCETQLLLTFDDFAKVSLIIRPYNDQVDEILKYLRLHLWLNFEWCDFWHRVPQGSVLVPTYVVLLYINDIASHRIQRLKYLGFLQMFVWFTDVSDLLKTIIILQDDLDRPTARTMIRIADGF